MPHGADRSCQTGAPVGASNAHSDPSSEPTYASPPTAAGDELMPSAVVPVAEPHSSCIDGAVSTWPRHGDSDHLEDLAQVSDPRAGPVFALEVKERRDVNRRIADLDGGHPERRGAGELSVGAVAAIETVPRFDAERIARVPIDRRVRLAWSDDAREDFGVDEAGERRRLPHRRGVGCAHRDQCEREASRAQLRQRLDGALPGTEP